MLFRRLRAETRDLHEQIERLLPVFEPAFQLKAYLDLLVHYLSFYSPVEVRLEELRAEGLAVFTDDRRKRPLLLKDLEALRCSPSAPEAEAIPVLRSVNQGIGCMYVLEGSTLGGRIIERHLKEKLGITAEHGGAFFASYGENLGLRWNEFRAAINAESKTEADMDEIVASARSTFECFAACLSRPVEQAS